HRCAAGKWRLRLRPAFPRPRNRPHGRRASAREEERALASRQGDARADCAAHGVPRVNSPAIATLDAASLTGPRFAALPPLALYVHIPWCLRKCPYCDFNSHEARGEVPETRYVDALIADLEQALPSIWGRKIVSVFIGGGTPSLFSASAI